MGGSGQDLTIRLEGLKKFSRDLKAIDPELVKAMKRINFDVGDMVAQEARTRAKRLGGVWAKTSRGIKATKKAKGASITVGGARYQFAWGAEFGAMRYKQFGKWRGNRFGGWQDTRGVGYFLHPAIKAMAEESSVYYLAQIEKLAKRAAFPD